MDRLWTPWRYSYISREDSGSRKGVPPELADWPAEFDTDCVFCNLLGATAYAVQNGMDLVAADRAARIVYRGQHCFICLNAFPYSTGHVLLLPYEHLDTLAALPAASAIEMMHLAQRTETALRQAYSPNGLNFGFNLGESAGAGVAGHLHMHALPRWVGDANFMTVVAETRVLPETLETTWQKLHRIFTLQATADTADSSISNKSPAQ